MSEDKKEYNNGLTGEDYQTPKNLKESLSQLAKDFTFASKKAAKFSFDYGIKPFGKYVINPVMKKVFDHPFITGTIGGLALGTEIYFGSEVFAEQGYDYWHMLTVVAPIVATGELMATIMHFTNKFYNKETKSNGNDKTIEDKLSLESKALTNLQNRENKTSDNSNFKYISKVCNILNEIESEDATGGLAKLEEAAKYTNQIKFNKTKSYLKTNIQAKVFSVIKDYIEYNSLSPANKIKKDIETIEKSICKPDYSSCKEIDKKRKKIEKLNKKYEKINNKECEAAKKSEKELTEIEADEKDLKQKLWDYSRNKIKLTKKEIQTIENNLNSLNDRYITLKSDEISDINKRKQEISENVKNAWETYEHLNELGSAGYFLENGFEQDIINENEKYAIANLGEETENIAKSIALTEYVLLGSGYDFILEDRIVKVDEEEKTNFSMLSHKRIKNMLDEISEDVQLEEKEANKLIDLGKLCDYIHDWNLTLTINSQRVPKYDFNLSPKINCPKIFRKEMVAFFKNTLDNLIDSVDEKTRKLVQPEI